MLNLGRRPLRMRGFTIIELMIVIVVMGLLMMIGLPTMTLMLKNGQVRTAAESAIAGLQTARNEAIRRNTPVRFYLTSDTTSGCNLSSTGTSWVVSLTDPTAAGSKCATAPIDPSTDPAAGNPGIIQTRSGTEGTTKATVSGVDSTATAANTVTFNGVGRVAGTGIATLDFAHVTDACQHAATPGPIRCLRILVSTGGTIKMCDPNVTAADSRFCGL